MTNEKTPTSQETAENAGLRYVYDTDPGVRRKKCGRGYVYYTPEGCLLSDRDDVERIKALNIPGNWRSVWICPFADGYIQATGLDSRGRKQYRYHDQWPDLRNRTRFENMLSFGKILPVIRGKVRDTLNRQELSKDSAIAAIVRLLDKSGINRDSNGEPAENEAAGLIMIRQKHMDLHQKDVPLDFPGKGGKAWHGHLTDPKVTHIMSEFDDMPGYRLFKILDDRGRTHTISSDDVNEWLRAVSGENITAKDFRTWTASALFLESAEESEGAHDIKPVLSSVAERLGNTPTILQKNYIHPDLLELYREGQLDLLDTGDDPAATGLYKTESALIRWLEKRYG